MNKIRKGNAHFSLDLISEYRSELFGLSILSIIVFHFFNHVKENCSGWVSVPATLYDNIISSVGVDCFVFLSGMGLFFSLMKDNNIRSFYSKRLKRVVVPYAIWGAAFWIVKDLLALNLGFAELLYDFSLLSFWLEGTRVLWYIGFIVIMYLAFPLIFRFLNSEKHSLLRLLILLAVCLGATAALKLLLPEVYDNIEIAVGRIPIFLIGTYMGRRIYRHEQFGIGDAILLASGIVLHIFAILIRYDVIPLDIGFERYEFGLFSISLIYFFVWILSKLRLKMLNTLLKNIGALSLELYMTHVTIDNLMRFCGYPTYEIRYYLICIALSVIFSLLLHFSLKNTQKHKGAIPKS